MQPLEPSPRELVPLRHVPLGRLVTVAGHLTGQHWGRYLAEHHGLTPAGMSVLFALSRSGEATHRQMAEQCFVRPATLTGVVDTLERDGFVERRRDTADRRTVRLALTDKGTRRVRSLIDVMQSKTPLTSVDADPAKAAVIREFLTELIRTRCDTGDGTAGPHRPGHGAHGNPGGHPC